MKNNAKSNSNTVFNIKIDEEISFQNIFSPVRNINIYKFDKNELADVERKKLVSKNGLFYILESKDKKNIYIGQSDNTLKRIKEHILNNKKTFDNVYIVSHSNGNFNTDIRKKIEEFVINLFKNSSENYILTNEQKKSNIHLNENDVYMYDELTEHVKDSLWILQFNVKEAKTINNVQSSEIIEDDNLFFFKKWGEVLGTLKYVNNENEEGFYLLAGSKVAESWKEKVPSKRDERMRREIKMNSNNILLEDYFYKTPSALLCLVYGRALNGWNNAKNKNGLSLNEYTGRKPKNYVENK